MTVAGNDVLRCTQEMTFPTIGAVQNVFHLRNDGPSVTDVQAIADVIEVLEALAGILASVLALLQIVNGVRIVNVTQSTDVGFGTFVDNTPYTAGGAALPAQCALGINLTTERLSVVGRKYFGLAVTPVNVSGGVLTAGTLTALANVGDEMTEAYEAVNSDWRYGVVATLDGEFLPFESYTIPTMMIVQRRRRLGVGI